MTQGAPRKTTTTRKTTGRTTKPKPNPLVRESAADQELDLNDWLAKRGLIGTRRLRLDGEPFDIVRSATGEQLAAYTEAREQGDILGAIAALLVDPDQDEAFRDAFRRQRSPLTGEEENAFVLAMLDFALSGDPEYTPKHRAAEAAAGSAGPAEDAVGESSAS
ncbi:hypothetical protein F9C11_20585 [Amycolatopsis sp. VS8301801F10]|uniref:hypothetical protein n=1 Tax=unclassified Amycolatopsis TaxID=2618356 RepID=UPI0038FC5C7A